MKVKNKNCKSKSFITFAFGFMLCFFMATSSWAAKKIDLSPANANDYIRQLSEKGITGKALGLTNKAKDADFTAGTTNPTVGGSETKTDYASVAEVPYCPSNEDTYTPIVSCVSLVTPTWQVDQVISGVKKKNLGSDANIQGLISSVSRMCCKSSCCKCDNAADKDIYWATWISDDNNKSPHANGAIGMGYDENNNYVKYYVQTINTNIGIFDINSGREDGEADGICSLNDFFRSSKETCSCQDTYIGMGDPFVLYDRYNQRWFIIATGRNDNPFFSIAASKTGDPKGEWWIYCLKAENTGYFINTPQCGLWHDGIYITANMLSEDNNPNTYQYTRVWALKTPNIYTGELITQSIKVGCTTDTRAKFLLPSNAGSPDAPIGPNIMMYSMDSDDLGKRDAIYVWTFDIKWDVSDQTSFTFTGPVEIPNITPFDLSTDGVPQPGTETELDSHAGRLMYPANYWKFKDHESVVLCHVCDVCDTRNTRRRAMCWYELRRDSDKPFYFKQQGTVYSDSEHYWMGSIAINGNEDIAMGFSVSSKNLYPSIRYAGRLGSCASGTMNIEEFLLDGKSSQKDHSEWGECSSTFVDPTDNLTFWHVNQYYTSSGSPCTPVTKICLSQPPVANFIGSPLSGRAPLTVHFTDQSTNNPTSWSWNFGDGITSTSQNPSHTYTSAGTYTVTLTASNDYGSDTETKTGYITVTPPPPVAAFTGNPTTVLVGGTVAFTDQSTNSPTSWSWKFPGGTPSTSTAKNPSIEYNTPGTYYVSLTAINAYGSGSLTKTNYITVTNSITDEIANALDYFGITFTKSNWSKVTDLYYYGGDAAKSSAIGDNQSATIQTTVKVTQNSTVKFYWKVSSEAGYDFLKFYIDGVEKSRISGEKDWNPPVSFYITAGTHILKWTYSKDARPNSKSGSDCGWVDKLSIATLSADHIAYAVDYPSASFTLSGNTNWFAGTTTTYYGGHAAQSGTIGDNQSSTILTTVKVTQNSTVKFYWKVSSEAGYDLLKFYIDGVEKSSISGAKDWNPVSFYITAGLHTLKWTYSKDARPNSKSGTDCGWIDKLEMQ